MQVAWNGPVERSPGAAYQQAWSRFALARVWSKLLCFLVHTTRPRCAVPGDVRWPRAPDDSSFFPLTRGSKCWACAAAFCPKAARSWTLGLNRVLVLDVRDVLVDRELRLVRAWRWARRHPSPYVA